MRNLSDDCAPAAIFLPGLRARPESGTDKKPGSSDGNAHSDCMPQFWRARQRFTSDGVVASWSFRRFGPSTPSIHCSKTPFFHDSNTSFLFQPVSLLLMCACDSVPPMTTTNPFPGMNPLPQFPPDEAAWVDQILRAHALR